MSCLFDSLNYFIKDNSNNIREQICNYLQENKIIIEGLETNVVLEFENTPNYIEQMRNSSTQGGAIEIQVACNIWNIRVIVKTIDNKYIEFVPISSLFYKTINLYWTGNHYEPIRV